MQQLLFFPEQLSGDLHWMQLQEHGVLEQQSVDALTTWHLPKALSGQGVYIILPGQRVTTYQLEMPKVSGSNRQKAVAFALEGECAQPLNTLYVIPGVYENGQQTAAVIERQYLNTLLHFIKKHRIKVLQIHVDYELLKTPNNAQWSIAQYENNMLWLSAARVGGSMSKVLWLVFVNQMLAQQKLDAPVLNLNICRQHGSVKHLDLPDDILAMCQVSYYSSVSWIDSEKLIEKASYDFNVGTARIRTFFDSKKRLWRHLVIWCSIAFGVSIIFQIGFSVATSELLKYQQKYIQQALSNANLPQMSLVQAKQRMLAAADIAQELKKSNAFLIMLQQVTQWLTPTQMATCKKLSYKAQQSILMFPMDKSAAILKQLQIHLIDFVITTKQIKQHNNLMMQIIISKAGLNQ